MNARQLTVNAKMWYSGSGHKATTLPSGSTGISQARICCMLATRLRLVSMAPFDTPVVPPVYCKMIVSSGPEVKGLTVNFRPCLRHSVKQTVLDRLYFGTIFFTRRTMKLTSTPLRPSISPMLVRITVLICVSPMI